MCSTCSGEGSSTTCLACLERGGVGERFPLSRDRWSAEELVRIAWGVMTREWLTLSLASLVVIGVPMAVNLGGTLLQMGATAAGFAEVGMVISILGVLLQTLVQGVVQLGSLRMTYRALMGRPIQVSQVWGLAHRLGQYLLQILAIVVGLGVPIAVYLGATAGLIYATGGFELDAHTFIIGGIAMTILIPALLYVTVPLYFMTMELALDDEVNAWDAMRNSYSIGDGFRWSIIGVSFVVGLIVLVGVLACCVGLIPALALGNLVMVGLFLTLRQGSDLAPLRQRAD